MKITLKKDLTPKANVAAVIYGQAKIGKTTLCGKGEKTLLFDLERGARRSQATGAIAEEIESLEKLMEFIKQDSTFDNYVFDTGEALIELIGQDAKRENPRLLSPAMALKYYGAVNDRLKDFVFWAKNFNKNILVICHTKENEKADTFKIEPRFGSANNNNLMLSAFDCVGLIQMNGKDRILTFNPTENNLCGNSLNIQDVKLTIEMDIWDIFKKAKDEEANKSLENSIVKSDILEKLKTCETKEFFDNIVENIKECGLSSDADIRKAAMDVRQGLANSRNKTQKPNHLRR